MRAGRHPQRHRGARRWTDTHHPTLPNPLFGREPQRTLEGKLVRIALVYGDPQKYDILWVVTHADADKLEGGELDQTRRRSEKLKMGRNATEQRPAKQVPSAERTVVPAG